MLKIASQKSFMTVTIIGQFPFFSEGAKKEFSGVRLNIWFRKFLTKYLNLLYEKKYDERLKTQYF